MSIVLTTLFAGSAMGMTISRVAPKPQMQMPSFECGSCGGMPEGCPFCRGPSPSASSAFTSLEFNRLASLVESESQESAVNSFECGSCGGMPEGCPFCRGPSPSAFDLLNVGS